jgi:hypothetical protein
MEKPHMTISVTLGFKYSNELRTKIDYTEKEYMSDTLLQKKDDVGA